MDKLMIAVTIGVGEKYELLATLAADSCRQRTGLEVHILGPEAALRHGVQHPHHLKFRMFEEFPEVENILYFDADTIFLKQFDPRAYANLPELVCVGDLWDRGWVIQDARRVGIPPKEYFNSGFFILNRTHHRKLLERAEALLKTLKSPFKDQTQLNAARVQLGIAAHWLPKEFNWLDFHHLMKPADANNIVVGHMHGIAGRPVEQLRWFYAFWSCPVEDFRPRIGRGDAILKHLRGVTNPSGAEIGVLRGKLSAYLLAARPDLRLRMVDPWLQWPKNSRYEQSPAVYAHTAQATWDRWHADAFRRTDFAAGRRTIMRAPSLEAAAQVPDRSLDFAFVDGDHTYEGCIEDIRAWLPKVKHGGLLCGHDIELGENPKWGVKRAVDEISAELNRPYELDEDVTWFIRMRSA